MRLSSLFIISLTASSFVRSHADEALPRERPATTRTSAAVNGKSVQELELRAAELDQQKNAIEQEVNRGPALAPYVDAWTRSQADYEAVKSDKTKDAAKRIAVMNSVSDAKTALDRRRAGLLRDRKDYGVVMAEIRRAAPLLERAKQEEVQREEEMRRIAAAQLQAEARKTAAQERLLKVPDYLRSRDRMNTAEMAPVETVPLQGNEVPLQLFKQRYKDYVENPAVVCVSIVSTDRYEGTYRNAKDSHYAFMIYSVDMKAQLGQSEYAYLLRALGDDLLNHAVRNEIRGARAARVVRLRIVVDKGAGHVVAEALPEITDWQFLNDDAHSWGPWYSEVDPVGIDLVRKAHQLDHDHLGMMSYYQYARGKNPRLYEYFDEREEKQKAKYEAEKERVQAELHDYRERNGLDLVKRAMSKDAGTKP